MNVKTINFKSKNAKSDFLNSLHKTGFAIIENHPINKEEINLIYSKWSDFFKSKEKHLWLRDPIKQDGYFPFKSENAKNSDFKDLKEFYHVYPWGKVPTNLELSTRKIYDDLNNIGMELLSWLDEEMTEDVSSILSEKLKNMMLNSEQSLLRILHYPPLVNESENGASRAAEHEDINLITLLLAGSEPGLQAKDTKGKWHEIACSAGMISVNNGDMLSLASNGYFPSTPHRVVNPEGNKNVSRFSMPMFLHPRPDVKLKDDFTADQFLQQRLREIGLK